mmetsp:Transcript_41333/g.76931  ORF Transcript_41333/g.76931 Transcript_41333/m.76931 type:complete len:364 (-) Transcript_41333:31-1122(-)
MRALATAMSMAALGLAAQSELKMLHADDECATGGESCSLSALQTRSSAQSMEADDVGSPGLIYAMYTFGAVATSTTPLEDLSQESKSFRGLRCYSETIMPGGHSRLTDIATIFMGLQHPKVPTLALHWKKDSEYFPGSGRPDLPKHEEGRAGDVSLHNMRNYIDRLADLHLAGQKVAQNKPFTYSHLFGFLAWGAYEKQKNWVNNKEMTMEEIIAQKLPGWNLVAQTQQDTLEAVDNMWLVQDAKTLDCVIAFEGTHTFNEFFGNLKSPKNGYCGFKDVHAGYADKLFWLMKYSMPRLRPSLAKCNKVSCTGHSLGGSLCEVFAACANSRRTEDKHYQIQMWTKGTPELMPTIHQLPLSRHHK